jgi:predicted lipoprotein with Yx(FWY)xxD motif
MRSKYIATLASAGVIALVVAGCGSSSGGGSSSKPSSSSAGPMVTASSSSLGKIITDGQGRTLYQFAKDTGMQSNCTGTCASLWPPFTASGKPAAGSGVTASAIKLVKRSDGAKQVTLDGHPLYFFSGDKSAGQTNGQGLNDFGAKWFTTGPSGATVTGAPKSSGGGGYGFSY